jgi:uncharacterized protein YkwD
MLLALFASVAVLIGNDGPGTGKPALNSADVQQPSPQLIAAALPSPNEDPAAEKELLQLANESRQRAGVPPLHFDQGLNEAAREHARLMVANGQLSHQYAGEPALLERIAQVSSLRMDRAGENVAYNTTAESAHDALMHSPPHRENLLDPNFNTTGIAALWSNGRLYVVEDFAHQVASYSAQQTRQLISRAVNDIRSQAGLPQLRQVSTSGLDEAVCSLARQNRVTARPLNVSYPSREIVTYTQSQPDILPQSAVRLLKGGGVSRFAVGACYARGTAYPTGMYWVAILLY